MCLFPNFQTTWYKSLRFQWRQGDTNTKGRQYVQFELSWIILTSHALSNTVNSPNEQKCFRILSNPSSLCCPVQLTNSYTFQEFIQLMMKDCDLIYKIAIYYAQYVFANDPVPFAPMIPFYKDSIHSLYASWWETLLCCLLHLCTDCAQCKLIKENKWDENFRFKQNKGSIFRICSSLCIAQYYLNPIVSNKEYKQYLLLCTLLIRMLNTFSLYLLSLS